MKAADLVNGGGKLVAKLPDGRHVEYTITNLGKHGATATATVAGQPHVKIDLTTMIRSLQRGDTRKQFQFGDSAFDWPVQQVIEKMFPDPHGYRYGGSAYAGTRISHPGSIGDVSVWPANKFDWIWRGHDVSSFLQGHFKTDAVVHIHTTLGRERFVTPDAGIGLHLTALKATLDEVERRVAARIIQSITPEQAAAVARALAGLFDLARESLRWILLVIDPNQTRALSMAYEIARNTVRAVLKFDAAFAVAGLLGDQPPLADESVFGELLTPPSSPSDDSAEGRLAVRVSDFHECPEVTATVAHVGGPVSTGSDNIYIGGELAARLGDTLICQGPPDMMCVGSGSVFWNGRPAVRVADGTTHGGKTVAGDSAVYVG